MTPPVLASLGEQLDAVADADLDTLTDAELDRELMGLLRARHRLDAEIARRAARWDARVVWVGDGSRSGAARLCRAAKLAHPEAKRLLRRAHAATAMPTASAAWRRGNIGADQVDLLARAVGSGRRDLFARDEELLVGHCAELSHRQAAKAIEYWCHRAHAELGSDGQPPSVEPSLKLTTLPDGVVTGQFVLEPVGGGTVSEALRRIERDLYRQDQKAGTTRSMPERMAAALVEMAVRAMTPGRKGHRPEPLLCILAGEATVEHLCELATGAVIHPGFIVPHLDRMTVQSFIFDGADRVLTTSKLRTFRGTLRRAVQVRDRRCQHPAGCDAPITECDVDHVVPHAEGGETSERGGRLQCEPHNRKSDLHHRAPPTCCRRSNSPASAGATRTSPANVCRPSSTTTAIDHRHAPLDRRAHASSGAGDFGGDEDGEAERR